MHTELARDSELHRAVERARALNGALRRLGKEPVPLSLYARLSGIPTPARGGRRRPRSISSWTSAAVAASTIAATLLIVTQPDPVVVDDQRMAALRDFEVAMGYLHRSYEITGEQVRRTMERELREVLGVDSQAGSDGRGENGG
jgi:hypothetical protein